MMAGTLRGRILVTGAGGFVGSNIVAALLEADWHVYALDRAFDSDFLDWFPQFRAHTARLELIEADAINLPDVPADALVHGAAITADPEQTGQTPEDPVRANLEPLFVATAWARARHVRRALFISSAAVIRKRPITPGRPLPVVAEESHIEPISPYAVAKATLEHFVTMLGLAMEADRRFVALRLSNIYGPGERMRATRPRMSVVGRLAQAALDERRIRVPINAPAGDWTFAPDIGRAVCVLLDAPALRHNLYQVTSAQMYSPVDIARQIGSLLPDITLDLEYDPDAQLGRGPLTNQRLAADTGFSEWTTLADGLRRTIDWFESRRERQNESAGRP